MNAVVPMPSSAISASDDPRWRSVVARDARADGTFVYCVSTTGVYCRPSCPSRRARPEHVRFFDSASDAERAGFRPCKRCKPDQLSLAEERAQKVTAACRLLEQSEESVALEELAAQMGLSPYHFHRIFKQVTGVTPRQYAAAQREKRIRRELENGGRVTDAIFSAGYGSNSRFYEGAAKVLGMTPTRYRDGGAGMEIKFAVGECSLGSILVAQSALGVCAILLGDDPQQLVIDLQERFPRATLIGADREFEQLIAQVVGFVETPALGFNLPLDVRGTAFQKRVWDALRDIPPGETATYTQIAARIGAPRAVRAVAQACASNTLAVAIPCHRVVRNDGSLSGYRWGVERKRALLENEKKNREGD